MIVVYYTERLRFLTNANFLLNFFSIEKGTENELSYTREQSATRRRVIEKLKTELEAEKQKTSQKLTELKSLHEISKTETLEQIQKLADLIQQLIGESLF